MSNINWIAKNHQNEVNEVLGELSLPQLHLTMPMWDREGMLKKLIACYKKEAEIQQPWGGIRQPPVVFHNKIRHDLTNYDEVRDALTEASEGGMDKDLVLTLQEELVKLFCATCEIMISYMPKDVQIRDSGKKVTITIDRLKKANHQYRKKSLALIAKEKRRLTDQSTPVTSFTGGSSTFC